MTILEAKEFLQKRGYYVIDYATLQTIIETATLNALKKYEEEKARNRLYSKKEVAGILGIHPSTISSWIKEGKIRVTKTGKITYQEILRLMTEDNKNI